MSYLAEIRRSLELLVKPGSVVELRCLFPRGARNGYFDDFDLLASTAAQMSGNATGVYITLNEINPLLLARRSNRMDVGRRDEGTKDSDVISRRWFPLDFDPVRPKGISSTDAEQELAFERAREVREWLRKLGWPDPVFADSGNGAHLLYRTNLPNDDDSRDLIAKSLQIVALRFSDDTVDVDTTVSNASRIWKLYGTIAAKGDSTPERPHRLARILEAPDTIATVDNDLLSAIAAELPAVEPATGRGTARFDVGTWLSKHEIEVLYTGPWGGAWKWVLRVCPWNPEHVDRSACVVQFQNGAIAASCRHTSCAGKGWRELRSLYEPVPEEATRWEPPLPFHSGDLPEFPVDALPEPLESIVRAEAIATQTPTALAGGVALTVCAIGVAKKVHVRVRRGWEEPINLYTVTILPSGELKTAVVSDLGRPIDEYEMRERRRLAPEIKEAVGRLRILHQRLKKAEKAAAATKPDDSAELEAKALSISKEIDQVTVPLRPQLLADDVTPEKLASLLSLHGGRMAVVSAEGGIFDLLGGRYSTGGDPNFEVFLKGHSGETLRIDRMTREPEYVPKPSLCVALAVQPDVVHGMAATRGFRGRGLIARFLYAWPNSLLGGRDPDALPLPESLRREYDRIVTAVLELPFEIDENGEPFSRALTLTDEACAIFLQFRTSLEPKLGPGGDLSWMTDWAGKLCGAIARIAGIIHMVAHIAAGTPWRQPISEETMLRAIILGEFYLVHARRTLGRMGADPALGMAEHILAWIRRSKSASFSKRDAFNALRGRVQKASDLDPTLGLLVEHSYVRELPQEPKSKAGRPKGPRYETNPAVLNIADIADFALKGGKSTFDDPFLPSTGDESLSDPLAQNTQNTQNPDDAEPEEWDDDAAE